MKAHTEEDFHLFLSQLLETNRTLDFYCDYEKIADNVGKISMQLNALNYLIGKENLRQAIRELWAHNPKDFEVLNILIAVRDERTTTIHTDGITVPMTFFWQSADHVIAFIEGTGLDKVLQDKQIKNLVDYVFGVETGLDTNARKNRSGYLMETRVANLLKKKNIPYYEQRDSSNYKPLAVLGSDRKVFDFVIETPQTTYCMEVNFYSGGGSKLNEVARSYSELAPKINALNGFRFVWITDGKGWLTARNKLEEAFYAIPDVYNLTTLDAFLDQIQSEFLND